MTFINAGILAALGAMALPLLIHLFNRQRHRDVDFSTLKFLKLLERERMRKVRLTEWLLLILRTAAVGAIVFAFARPAIQKMWGFLPGEADTIAVLMVDNSLSSQVVGPWGSAISEERRRAVEALDIFVNADRVAIISAAEPARSVNKMPLPGGDERLRRAIFELETSDAAVDWRTAFQEGMEFLRNADQPNKEIYLFSTFYSGDAELDSALADLPEQVRVFLVSAGLERSDNLAILSVELETQIIQVGGAVTFSVTAGNFSGESCEEVPISVYLGGERVASTDLNIPPLGETVASFKVIPKEGGFISGRVKLEAEDALTADNSRYFSFYAPDRIDVYLAGDSAEVADVSLALAPASDRDYAIEPQILKSVAELGEYPSADVVFLVGSERLSPFEAGMLGRLLERGGGVLISPSEKINPAAVNREFLQPLGAPQLGDFISGSEATWSLIDYQHPIFAGVFGDSGALESPIFHRRFKLMGVGGSDIIGFRGGDAYLKEVPIGGGTMLIFAAGFSDYWGDIAYRGIFAPLMHRAAEYLGSKGMDKKYSLTAGKAIEYFSKHLKEPFEILKPDGSLIELLSKPGGNSVKLTYEATGASGIYRLMRGDEIESMFAVNPSVEANPLHRIIKDEYPAELQIAGNTNLADAILSGRLGDELWRVFLLIGIGCLALESLIVRIGNG
ncbi:MAG: BatA domain-containing protein [candidate division Zixibacteria bacterium]|nr:BatA domain-containing protein [Candidatus Tariuqbacter arcticus]